MLVTKAGAKDAQLEASVFATAWRHKKPASFSGVRQRMRCLTLRSYVAAPRPLSPAAMLKPAVSDTQVSGHHFRRDGVVLRAARLEGLQRQVLAHLAPRQSAVQRPVSRGGRGGVMIRRQKWKRSALTTRPCPLPDQQQTVCLRGIQKWRRRGEM